MDTKSIKSLGQNVLLAAFTFLMCYAMAEAVLTYRFIKGKIVPFVVRVNEDNAEHQSYAFDPVKGYTISRLPTRLAIYSSDKRRIESIGTLVGNNEGFPDRDDFYPEKKDSNEVRIAVFGDSFTAGQFIRVNWPQRIQDKFKRDGNSNVVLYNFAVDAGGLGNWWSIMTRHLAINDYELDGVVFLVRVNDLSRSFFWWDDSIHKDDADGNRRHVGQYSPTWNPEEFPSDINELDHQLIEGWKIVSTETFNGLENGLAELDLDRPFKLYLLSLLKWFPQRLNSSRMAHQKTGEDLLLGKVTDNRSNLTTAVIQQALAFWDGRDVGSRQSDPNAASSQGSPARDPLADELPEGFPVDGHQAGMLAEMKAYLTASKLPTLVIDGGDVVPVPEHCRAFAGLIGASYFDVNEHGAGYIGPGGDIPYDGHWNQLGSDRWANYIYPFIREWVHNDVESL